MFSTWYAFVLEICFFRSYLIFHLIIVFFILTIWQKYVNYIAVIYVMNKEIIRFLTYALAQKIKKKSDANHLLFYN